MKKREKWKIFVVCLIIVYLVAFIGSIFTSGNTRTDWYESSKPSITPPSWIFPVVWNILFFLISLSLYLAWINIKNKNQRKRLISVFAINLILNALWSYFFFSLRRPDIAFYELIFLWASIILMIGTTYKMNKNSSYLLWPYLLWVSFAGILNYLFI